MAKARKKTRKAAKRPVKKRKAAATRAKARKPARKKTRRPKPAKPNSLIGAVAQTVLETGELHRRLAGPNTFED